MASTKEILGDDYEVCMQVLDAISQETCDSCIGEICGLNLIEVARITSKLERLGMIEKAE